MEKSKFDAMAKANDAINAISSPFDAVVQMYAAAPEGIQAYLDFKFMEIIGVDVPKMAMLAQDGYTLKVDADYKGIGDVYRESMDGMREHAPQVFKQLSATVRDGGENIADAIDTAIKRAVGEATTVNREAYLDILASHAKIVRAMEGLLQGLEGLDSDEPDPAT